jgi:hypothetical protein
MWNHGAFLDNLTSTLLHFGQIIRFRRNWRREPAGSSFKSLLIWASFIDRTLAALRRIMIDLANASSF